MKSIFQRRYMFHVFFWITFAIFMLLEVQGYSMRKGWFFAITPVLICMLLMAVLVYGHILILIPFLLRKKKVALYILGIIVLVITYTLVRSRIQQYWDGIVWPDEPMKLKTYFRWNLFYAVWFILISSMLFFTQKWGEQQQQVKNIQINQLQTELKYLRSQINPHFLFNGLNTIYGSIDMSNQQARDILLQFSDLLRYNLYEADVDWVDLEKEALYLQNYVALQRARSNTNVTIDLDISIGNKTVKIAPLIFIAFIENAFKFSSRDDNSANTIKITLEQKGDRIEFNCSNNYENDTQVTGGIGLANVTRRLELLYKDHYILNIKKEQGTYSVHLILTV